MQQQESREHHYVPRFLLRAWCIDGQLHGYRWDAHKSALRCDVKGPKAFCREIDLLTLHAHRLGRDAIERIFFGEVDTKGAEAMRQMLAHGAKSLSHQQRSDFARLLLSLDLRRPPNVELLRAKRAEFAEGLNNDPEILAAMKREGLSGLPSDFYERHSGTLLEDRALAMIQRLVDNPKVGGKLINAHWQLKRIGERDPSLVLADRPLIRLRGYDQPGAAWVLPISPRAAFVANNHAANHDRVRRLTGLRFAKATNVSSAGQAERYVFAVEDAHARWLPKWLRPR